MKIDKKYISYAEDVLSGKIVACEYIKLSCKRYLSFFEREDMYFDCKAVDKVVNFISKLKHLTGEHNGKPFILSDWQFWMVCNIFGFKWEKNNRRVTRTAFIQVGRKNGKSTFLAAISAYCLVADGEASAQVVFAANSAKQAGLCFGMTSKFLGGVDPKNKLFKRYRDKIKFDYTNSEIIVTAADASKLDGLNCSMFCQDELEEAPNGKLWNVLETSQGMRTQPLAIAICTAGFDLSSFCYEMRCSAIETLYDKKTDDTLFSAIYELDKDDDYTDPSVWKKANPNLDITIKSEYLQQQLNKAKNNPTLQTSVLTKLFNQWLSSSEEWISANYIMKAQKKFNYSDFEEPFAYLGVDLGATSDLTCISCMIPYEEKLYFRNYYFLPSECLTTNPNRELYRLWKQKGHLIVTPGNVCDYDAALNELMKLNEQVQIVQISYDSWNATQFAISATENGLPLVPFSQSISSLNRPTKELARLILSGKVIIYENPIDRFCFENVVIKRDYNDNERPTKETYNNKIDGVMAMIMALGGYLTSEHWDNSVTSLNFGNT